MRHAMVAGALLAGLTVGACGSSGRTVSASSPDALTGASLAFTSLDSGKDDGSALTAQLLRNSNELVAETRSVGTAFDDNAVAPTLAMTVNGPFRQEDAQGAQLRLRMVPEGRDTWTFNARLTLSFANGSQRSYSWMGVQLDESSPERTLTLAGAQGP